MTVAGDELPDRLGAPLPGAAGRVVGGDVLEEHELASGREHAADLLQTLRHVADGAEHERADDGIEGVRFALDVLGGPGHELDLAGDTRGPASGLDRESTPHVVVGLREHQAIELAVVVEVRPRARADLENVAAELRKELISPRVSALAFHVAHEAVVDGRHEPGHRG
jgi:hypothetical protein